MKAIQFFLTSLAVAVTALAETEHIFYVEVGSEKKTLHGIGLTSEGEYKDFNALGYSDRYFEPVPFDLRFGVFAVPKNRVGTSLELKYGLLLVGPSTAFTELDIDENGQIKNNEFSACRMEDSDFYSIYYDTSFSNSGDCTDVKLFITQREV